MLRPLRLVSALLFGVTAGVPTADGEHESGRSASFLGVVGVAGFSFERSIVRFRTWTFFCDWQ